MNCSTTTSFWAFLALAILGLILVLRKERRVFVQSESLLKISMLWRAVDRRTVDQAVSIDRRQS